MVDALRLACSFEVGFTDVRSLFPIQEVNDVGGEAFWAKQEGSFAIVVHGHPFCIGFRDVKYGAQFSLDTRPDLAAIRCEGRM